MYHQEMARSGHALFTIRGLNIAVVIVIGAVIAWCSGVSGPFGEAVADCWWQVVSLGVALVGALWRVIVSGFAALGTSGNAKKGAVAAELNTTGPYSVVRNPLYVGRIVNFTGIAMLSGSWVYGALVFLISVLVYERISFYEEEFLSKEFGEAHRKWAEEIPALLPKLTGWVKPKYDFWWRRAIYREYQKFFFLLTALFLNDLGRRNFVLPEDMTLYYAFGGITVLALVTRLAGKFGKLFDGIS
ncbi:MAG: isoprenylcysteine carboxylmethyltransferase family protein [Novosphingobium sp.]|nr:isoprenylcysteine carboxylmethyltransferase family protein [Novosphingobium sp.]